MFSALLHGARVLPYGAGAKFSAATPDVVYGAGTFKRYFPHKSSSLCIVLPIFFLDLPIVSCIFLDLHVPRFAARTKCVVYLCLPTPTVEGIHLKYCAPVQHHITRSTSTAVLEYRFSLNLVLYTSMMRNSRIYKLIIIRQLHIFYDYPESAAVLVLV